MLLLIPFVLIVWFFMGLVLYDDIKSRSWRHLAIGLILSFAVSWYAPGVDRQQIAVVALMGLVPGVWVCRRLVLQDAASGKRTKDATIGLFAGVVTIASLLFVLFLLTAETGGSGVNPANLPFNPNGFHL